MHTIRNCGILSVPGCEVTLDPGAKVIGYVSAINEEDPWDQIPKEFRGYLDIMSQKAAEALPAHRPYDCKIDLKEAETTPWGLIYPFWKTSSRPSESGSRKC